LERKALLLAGLFSIVAAVCGGMPLFRR